MDKNGLRQQNLSLLRRTLKELHRATKPQLAEVSGLSVVTVNSLLKELIENPHLMREISRENLESIKPWDWNLGINRYREYFDYVLNGTKIDEVN